MSPRRWSCERCRASRSGPRRGRAPSQPPLHPSAACGGARGASADQPASPGTAGCSPWDGTCTPEVLEPQPRHEVPPVPRALQHRLYQLSAAPAVSRLQFRSTGSLGKKAQLPPRHTASGQNNKPCLPSRMLCGGPVCCHPISPVGGWHLICYFGCSQARSGVT